MSKTTISAEVANLIAEAAQAIDSSVGADAALLAAITTAGDSLNDAAILTYNALQMGATVRDIAAQTNGTNKDTVSRLAIVGQILSLSGEYAPTTVDASDSPIGAISAPHYMRNLVNRCIKSGNGAGITVIRAAVAASVDQKGAVKALQALIAGTAGDQGANQGEGDGEGEDDGADMLDDFAAACVAAVDAISRAMAAKPLAASDDDLARVLAVSDAAAMLSRTFAAVPVAEGALA